MAKNRMYTILSAMDADKAEELVYGYFANNLKDLKKALCDKKSSLRVLYARLEKVLGEEYERRFYTNYGAFSLFCPLDKAEERLRY